MTDVLTLTDDYGDTLTVTSYDSPAAKRVYLEIQTRSAGSYPEVSLSRKQAKGLRKHLKAFLQATA